MNEYLNVYFNPWVSCANLTSGLDHLYPVSLCSSTLRYTNVQYINKYLVNFPPFFPLFFDKFWHKRNNGYGNINEGCWAGVFSTETSEKEGSWRGNQSKELLTSRGKIKLGIWFTTASCLKEVAIFTAFCWVG